MIWSINRLQAEHHPMFKYLMLWFYSDAVSVLSCSNLLYSYSHVQLLQYNLVQKFGTLTKFVFLYHPTSLKDMENHVWFPSFWNRQLCNNRTWKYKIIIINLLTYASAKDTNSCNIITEATEARNATDALPWTIKRWRLVSRLSPSRVDKMSRIVVASSIHANTRVQWCAGVPSTNPLHSESWVKYEWG